MRKLYSIRTDAPGTSVSYLIMRIVGGNECVMHRHPCDELPYEYKACLGYFEQMRIRKFLRSRDCKWTMKEV